MRTARLLLTGIAALSVLAACTPEDMTKVIDDYAAMRTQQDTAESGAGGPTWSVDADCGGAHIALTGWTGVIQISPSTGNAYVLLGLGATNIAVGLIDGGVDAYVTADQGTRDTPAWPWSLVINGDPSLSVTGIADC